MAKNKQKSKPKKLLSRIRSPWAKIKSRPKLLVIVTIVLVTAAVGAYIAARNGRAYSAYNLCMAVNRQYCLGSAGSYRPEYITKSKSAYSYWQTIHWGGSVYAFQNTASGHCLKANKNGYVTVGNTRCSSSNASQKWILTNIPRSFKNEAHGCYMEVYNSSNINGNAVWCGQPASHWDWHWYICTPNKSNC
jgi:Ricin-type beta-trefoil lectin domain-like